MGPGPLRDAASALRYWELRQQVASNNLANAETPGFKSERVFARLLSDATVEMGARTDMRAGALRPTGNPLDIGIAGDGAFLVVNTPNGERLVRGGAMRLDEQSRIVDAAGHVLLAEDGPITIPEGATLTIDNDGTVRGNGAALGRLRVETVSDPAALEHEFAGLWRVNGERQPLESEDRGVRQGTLEASNSNTLDGMVELIEIQRAWAAAQGGVRALDGVLDTMVNRLGRVG
jgi:flagellar basal body rod protein FlgG